MLCMECNQHHTCWLQTGHPQTWAGNISFVILHYYHEVGAQKHKSIDYWNSKSNIMKIKSNHFILISVPMQN